MKKYKLKYPPENLGEPVLSEAILSTGTAVNILRASVDYDEGVIIISVLGDERKEKKIIDFIRGRGVEVEKLSGGVSRDASLCTDCGLCVGVCPTDAITVSEDYSIKIDNELCVQCNACVMACPLKALAIQKL